MFTRISNHTGHRRDELGGGVTKNAADLRVLATEERVKVGSFIWVNSSDVRYM